MHKELLNLKMMIFMILALSFYSIVIADRHGEKKKKQAKSVQFHLLADVQTLQKSYLPVFGQNADLG